MTMSPPQQRVDILGAAVFGTSSGVNGRGAGCFSAPMSEQQLAVVDLRDFAISTVSPTWFVRPLLADGARPAEFVGIVMPLRDTAGRPGVFGVGVAVSELPMDSGDRALTALLSTVSQLFEFSRQRCVTVNQTLDQNGLDGITPGMLPQATRTASVVRTPGPATAEYLSLRSEDAQSAVGSFLWAAPFARSAPSATVFVGEGLGDRRATVSLVDLFPRLVASASEHRERALKADQQRRQSESELIQARHEAAEQARGATGEISRLTNKVQSLEGAWQQLSGGLGRLFGTNQYRLEDTPQLVQQLQSQLATMQQAAGERERVLISSMAQERTVYQSALGQANDKFKQYFESARQWQTYGSDVYFKYKNFVERMGGRVQDLPPEFLPKSAPGEVPGYESPIAAPAPITPQLAPLNLAHGGQRLGTVAGTPPGTGSHENAWANLEKFGAGGGPAGAGGPKPGKGEHGYNLGPVLIVIIAMFAIGFAVLAAIVVLREAEHSNERPRSSVQQRTEPERQERRVVAERSPPSSPMIPFVFRQNGATVYLQEGGIGEQLAKALTDSNPALARTALPTRPEVDGRIAAEDRAQVDAAAREVAAILRELPDHTVRIEYPADAAARDRPVQERYTRYAQAIRDIFGEALNERRRITIGPAEPGATDPITIIIAPPDQRPPTPNRRAATEVQPPAGTAAANEDRQDPTETDAGDAEPTGENGQPENGDR